MKMLSNHYKFQRTFIGRLNNGDDLYDSLSKFCIDEDIQSAHISAIGAVKQATLAYYDQRKKKYGSIKIKKELEILNCLGNVSLKDGKPFVHAHITLADNKGRAFGGHLMSGTTVFACEVFIDQYDGPALDRKFDEKTGLFLWIS